MSIWIGNEQITCATVAESLSQGEMVLSDLCFTLDSATELCNKFYGIAPAPTPTPIIAEDVLNGKTAITSEQTLIDLAQKEVPKTYMHDSIAYDSNYKFWYISFESNDDLEIPYVVILSSEGITVTIYTML